MTTKNKNQTVYVFFQSTPCLAAHLRELMANEEAYISALGFLCESGTFSVVSSGIRARILAALNILSHHKTLVMLLKHCDAIDVSKALTLLDRPRKARQLKHRIQRIEKEQPHVILRDDASEGEDDGDVKMTSAKRKRNRRKVDVYRGIRQGIVSEIECEVNRCENKECVEAHENSAVKELIESASVSGALVRKVRHWAKTCLKSDYLEFVLLAMPHDIWRNLADLVHFSPSDFALPYFLADIYEEGEKSEERTFVRAMKELVRTSDEKGVVKRFRAIAEEFPHVYLSYAFIRLQPNLMKRPKIVEQLAQHAPLDTVIWYFEEFRNVSRNCEGILRERLSGGESDVRSIVAKSKATTYGKLLERILTFRRMGLSLADDVLPLAAVRLEELTAYWKAFVDRESKVAVFGDASSSMQRAIEAATIFASMVSACFDGELSFFSSKLLSSPHKKPVNVKQTLEVCDKIRANGCTSLAAALWPYYEKKVFVDMIVMVTDEEENTPYRCYKFAKCYKFAELLAEYKKSVNKNVTLVVVCVGKGCLGFRSDLERNKIDYKVVYIDDWRPDLAKFDSLLVQLALVSSRSGICFNTVSNEGYPSASGCTIQEEDEFVVVGNRLDCV